MSKDDWNPRSFVARQKHLKARAERKRVVKGMGLMGPRAAGRGPIIVDTGKPSSYGNKRRVNRA